VVLQAGRSDTANSYVHVDTPTSSGTYKVKTDIAGISNAVSAVQTVAGPDLRFSKSSVIVGKGLNTYASTSGSVSNSYTEVYVYRSVNGTALVGSNPVTVSLACSSEVICTVPATVTIPAGQSSAKFSIRGIGLGSTTITASAVGYSAAQDLDVNVVPPQLNISGPANTSVGGVSNFFVYLSVPGSYHSSSHTTSNPLPVNLTSSAPGVASVPGTITIPAASYSVYAPLTGVSAGTTTLTASGSDLSSTTSGVITITP